MISRQLIDLLNSGEAVSIVGSGISADAGIPTWNSLFNSIADALDREKRDTQMARVTATEDKLPEAFELLASQTNKSDIHKRITALIEQVSTPGTHHFQLADWPFRFHVTTNYDHFIEDASSGRLVPVGNRGSELPKVAGGCPLRIDMLSDSGPVRRVHTGGVPSVAAKQSDQTTAPR